MRIQYLEIVTKDVGGVVAADASAHNATFGEPDARLGNARPAALAGGGRVGGRAPLRETEEPVFRPYCLVDIENVAAALQAGWEVAHRRSRVSPPTGLYG